jgi:hypothetical protein
MLNGGRPGRGTSGTSLPTVCRPACHGRYGPNDLMSVSMVELTRGGIG